MNIRERVRKEMRTAGHQPTELKLVDGSPAGRRYEGGCRRCTLAVKVHTFNGVDADYVRYSQTGRLRDFGVHLHECSGLHYSEEGRELIAYSNDVMSRAAKVLEAAR